MNFGGLDAAAEIGAAGRASASRAWLAVGAATAGMAAATLWWRFGEAVYVNGLLQGLLACF